MSIRPLASSIRRLALVTCMCGVASAWSAPTDAFEPQVTAGAEAGLPKVGEPFQDCPECPLMVRVPSGSFQMGDPRQGRGGPAGPVREVTLKEPLAVGVYEVTLEQWDACLKAGGCRGHRLDDAGWGRGNRPAINLHWDDAQSYVSWLRKWTGKRYRLLTEGEWEYAARAGTATRFGWGNEIGVNRANCIGCGSRWDGQRTAPVGSFASNAWGLHDMHGNLWELVADCWQLGHVGAPLDGSAREVGDCKRRVMRGGGWHSAPGQLASSTRSYYAAPPNEHFIPPLKKGYYANVGFRVARALERKSSWVWDYSSRAEIESALGPRKSMNKTGVQRSIELLVPFALGAPQLAPLAAWQMKPLAAALSSGSLAAHDFRIIGLANASEDAGRNRALAQTRAQAVRCRLINTHGIAPSRLFVGEEGETALGRYKGEVFVSLGEYDGVANSPLMPKVTRLQKIRIVAMPNPSEASCGAVAGAECRKARYERWHETFEPYPCWAYKNERVKLAREIMEPVSLGILLVFKDFETLKDLDDVSRNLILEITSDAGLSPTEPFQTVRTREAPFSWWAFTWPYFDFPSETFPVCRSIEGKIGNLLEYCAGDSLMYPDIGHPVREHNRVWLPHLEGMSPRPRGQLNVHLHQLNLLPFFRDYVDERMLCC